MKAVNHLFILDSSGSMMSIKSQVIDLFNGQMGLIREQVNKTGIPSFVSLIVFGEKGECKNDWFDCVTTTKLMLSSLKGLSFMTDESYQPYGNTALYDAIGKGIKETEDALKYYFYSTDVVINIFTDGAENSSKTYSGDQIATLIKETKEDYGWQFNYFGANHDVEKFAKDHNIDLDNTISYTANAVGVENVSETMSDMTASYYINVKN